MNARDRMKKNWKNQDKTSYICKNNKIFDIYRMQNQDFIANVSKKNFGQKQNLTKFQ